jgi:hypothetical protein
MAPLLLVVSLDVDAYKYAIPIGLVVDPAHAPAV